MTAGNNNTLKFTFSAWVKRTGLSSNDGMQILSVADEYIYLGFASDSLRMEIHDSDNVRLRSNTKYRDTNAWYHVVFTFDSTQSTASDRMKMWVNNEQITDLAIANYPNQNYGTYIGTNTQHSLGRRENDDTDYFDGCMSHAHLTVGYAYTPSDFGETDSTTGEWKAKTSPSVTYGNNGFFILKDGNGITDQSGEGNDFTLGGGTLTDLKDNPDNTFAVFNTLDNYYPAMTLSNGNTKALTIAGKYTYIPTTLGMTSGKYYAEIKVTAQSGSQDAMVIGITSTSSGATTDELGHYANDYGYYGTGNLQNNDSNTSYGSSYTTGDIIGIAIDLDNNKLYFSKNSVWQNSGVPTSGSTGTGAVSITDPDSTPRGAYFFAVNNWSSTTTATFEANFGNGYFGTTAVTSAGTNASGNGIFEYDVPTGYTALSTRGLNT
jgi:hypothetical protein